MAHKKQNSKGLEINLEAIPLYRLISLCKDFAERDFLAFSEQERMEHEMLFLKVLTLVKKSEDPDEPAGFTV